jgi:gliding motility-associated protein GldE
LETSIEGESPGHQALFLLLQATPLTGEVGFAVFVVAVMLLVSALISGAEVAFFSLSPRDLKELQAEDGIRSRNVLSLLERPRYLLATLIIGNNLLNLGIIILSTVVLSAVLPADIVYWQKVLIEVGLVTFVIVVFGEIIPKIYAQHVNLAYAKATSGFVLLLRTVFKPLSRLLVNSTRFIERRLGNKPSAKVSVEELHQAIDITAQEDTTREEVNILKGIIKFGGIGVTQIMTPRMDIIAVDETIDFTELKRMVHEHGYSRLPVYRENIDSVTGILYLKDLLKHMNEGAHFKWQSLIRPAFFVPEAKKIEDLLREFQTRGIHMSIVVDEYGGTSGIATLEDVMEEIIGEIKDEFDPASEINFQKLNDRTYVFEGKTLINDFCKVLSLKPDTFDDVIGDSDSLAGLLLELTKRIPRVREKVSYLHFTFEVMTASKKQVQSIKVHIGENEEAVA